MQQTTLIVGGSREFTCARMNPFDANTLLLRIKKVALPIIGSFSSGSGKSLLDVDVKEAANVLAQHIDESTIPQIVLPMLDKAKVYCVEQKKFVKDEASINFCFTTENLMDFYELIFLVGRYQFGPFFGQVAARFGGLLAEKNPEQPSPESSTTTSS